MLAKNKLLLPLLFCFAHAAPAAQAGFPVTVENCGVSQTFTRPPQRVVTVGQHETELLLALGLASKISATSVWFGKLPPVLAKQGNGLKKLADNSPSFEAVVAQKPELVLAQYQWHIGPQGEVATREQFASLGIKTWISPADCAGKSVTQSSNADGARSTPFTMASIEQEINELAAIFAIPQQGDKLIQALKKRIAHAQSRAAADSQKPLKIVFWFSSSRLNGDPWVAGNAGAPAWISRTLGLKNIIDSNDEWPAVTWEHIAREQPDIIVIADMARRLYPADDVAVKIRFLRSDPVTKAIPAVKNNHIVVVPAMSLNPSLRNVDAVEMISEQMAAFQAK